MKSDQLNHTEDRVQQKSSGRTDHPIVAVVGLGYVGLPLALRADALGYNVIGIDKDHDHIRTLDQHRAPSFLDGQDRTHTTKHTIHLSIDALAMANADAIIVCVPTPVHEDHMPDLGPLVSACEALASHLKRGALVIIESTVNPGVCDEILLPILSRGSGLVPERDFLFAYCPERINPGDSKWNVGSIPRVLGAVGPESKKWAYRLYSRLIDAPIQLMENIKEAEAVKIMENSFRDINIAFVNELAMSFKKLDIDIMHVIEGAATKPFGFLAHYPGCGVGGHCIPVDPYYLIAYAKKNGFQHEFLETARRINNNMPSYTVDLLVSALDQKKRKLPGARIALLGLAYKRDVPDLRESPALVIEKELTRRGALVSSFDPYLPMRSTALSLEDAIHLADAVVVATDHAVFRSLTPQDFARHSVDIVLDGRNCLDKDLFTDTTVSYHGIGR